MFRGGKGVVEGIDAATRPRRHRHAHLLGEELRADLVAQLAHGLRGRADEGDAELAHAFRECRILRDEPPPRPDRVRPRLDKHLREEVVVQVRAVRSRAERKGLVGLAHEHRRAFTVGVKGDGGDGFDDALGVEVANGVDEAHGGLAAVHNGDSLKQNVSFRC